MCSIILSSVINKIIFIPQDDCKCFDVIMGIVTETLQCCDCSHGNGAKFPSNLDEVVVARGERMIREKMLHWIQL